MSRYLRRELTLTDLAALPTQPPMCDFCGLHAPRWAYAASRTQAGARIQCWRWCACPDCAAHVEAQHWPAIIRGLEATLAKRFPSLPTLLLRQAADRSFGDFHMYAIRSPA